MSFFNILNRLVQNLQIFLSFLGRPLYILFINSVALVISLFLALRLLLSLPITIIHQFLSSLLITILTLTHAFDGFLTHLLSPLYFNKGKLKKTKKSKLSASPNPIIVKLKISLLVCTFVFSIGFLATIFYFAIIYQLPNPETLANRPQKLTTQILDRNGRLLYKIYQDENRTLVKLNTLPPFVKQAFIAIEDKDFYSHQGFSITGIARAIERNLTDARIEGGSTITQQLVKNTLLTSERTWTRKIKELILAIKTELVYDKDTILEMYINEVAFGGPAYGIQEGAQQYFGIDAVNLSLSQATFLAGLPKAPSKFSPYLNPQLSIQRQHLVLNNMANQGYITSAEKDSAISEKLQFESPKIEIKAPHFVMYVRDLLVDKLGEDLVAHGGLIVTTSLDLDLQEKTQITVNQELEKLTPLKVSNGAALITVPQTGEILAMIGSRNFTDFAHDGQVNLTTSLRQPGSSIKPINYALALENGYTPSSKLVDSPISFNLGQSETWTPKNYDGKFHGSITLRRALASSYNIPAVMLLSRNGVTNMAALARQMGISTWNDESRLGLSLTLGSVEVKMTDMAQSYGALANLGLSVPLNPILKVISSSGKDITFTPCPSTGNYCQPVQALKPETAYLITDILSDNEARSPAFGINSSLNIKAHQVAVKTGTSNDLRDNWTIGYTPDFVVATWVGNNDNSPMSQVASGITGASPIWNKITSYLLNSNSANTPFSLPKNLVKVAICSITNTLPCAGCPTRFEYFTKGTEPKDACSAESVQKYLEDKAKQGNIKDKILTGATN